MSSLASSSQLLPINPPNYENVIDQSIVDVMKEENFSIHIERGSGMISLTKMFQSQGKAPKDYTKTQRFKNLKAALGEEMSEILNRTNRVPSNGTKTLFKIVEGRYGGTWIHKDLALDGNCFILFFFTKKIKN